MIGRGTSWQIIPQRLTHTQHQYTYHTYVTFDRSVMVFADVNAIGSSSHQTFISIQYSGNEINSQIFGIIDIEVCKKRDKYYIIVIDIKPNTSLISDVCTDPP